MCGHTWDELICRSAGVRMLEAACKLQAAPLRPLSLALEDLPRAPSKAPKQPLAVPCTTLKLSNVPFRYSQAEAFEELGLRGRADFFHLHGSSYLGHHVGVAIVNFLTVGEAQAFRERWQGRRMAVAGSKKPVKVSQVVQQGRYACLKEVRPGSPLLPIVRLGDEYLGEKETVHMVALARDGVAIMRL